jgi:polyphosphate kinase 2 (PPK2 family)
MGLFDPGGLDITSFKAPTEEELAHDFLWRVERALPASGEIGIFDRSHYEDVLVAKVHELAPPDEIERRYGAINAFEKRLTDTGTTVI